MSLPRSVAEVLAQHVTLEIEGIDRMYLNVYVPQLQREQGVANFFRFHRGHRFASSALMDPISKTFVAALEEFARRQKIPVIQFRKGQRKDDIAAEFLRQFSRAEGVVFIGKAQEKTPVFRTERRRSEKTGATYPWLVRSTAMVNQFYIYCLDRDFGPFFLKFSTYFPYNAKLCINGHEYAKQQLKQKGVGFEALDNGVLSCDNPKRLQAICDGLSAEKIDGLLRKWLRLLPHPYTAGDRRAGYRYDVSILQAEFSLTQVLDRPVTGRVFFEEVIRENLDIGRPSQVRSSTGASAAERRAGFAPESSPTASSPHSTSITRTPESSSITKRAVPYVRKPRSITRATSASARDSKICRLSGMSASRPTGVFSASKKSLTIARSAKMPSIASFDRSKSKDNAAPRCASAIHVSRLSLPCWSSSVSNCGVLPITKCASYWRNCWALTQPITPSDG